MCAWQRVMRLLVVPVLASVVTGCYFVTLPERFTTAREAFARDPEPVRSQTFDAPAADVYRATLVASRHTQLAVERADPSVGVILASRTVAGTAYFYRISIRESVPRRTHVVIATKMQRQCHYEILGSRTAHAAYCKWIAAPRWLSPDAAESNETTRPLLALIRRSLMEAGALTE